jgi:tetratricopeptide (TPR) repeat protein/predicted transcriptional regulator
MLLLYDNRKYVDDYDVPEVVSQTGIAGELNLRQNHVSRALTELITEKLIFSRSSHVKGVPRKRKVYFLTQKGNLDVKNFIRDLSFKMVLVHTTAGELREYSLERVAKEIERRLGYVPSYHQLLQKFSDTNEIDFNFLEDQKEMQKGIAKKLNIPMERHFYGRTKERDMIFKAISENQYQFIITTSIAGQGKTALMINIVSNIENHPIFWISLNEWSRVSNLLNDWGYFFKEHKKTGLFNYLGTTTQINIEEALKAFILDSQVLDPVFVIDDFQKANTEIVKMFKLLKELLNQEQNIVILISSRERPGFYGRKDVLVSKNVLELELQGLDKKDASMILREKGIPGEDFDLAYEVTKGHPLALELYTTALFSERQKANIEFDAFLSEEVIKEMDENETEVVKLASVFQHPVSRSAFFFKPEITQEIIDRLHSRLILRMYQNGTYDIHDLIKTYFINRLTGYEKKQYLKIAINYYSTRGSEKDILEYLRLLRESADKEQFISALLEHGDFLLSQGYTQIGEHLQEIDDREVSKLDGIRLLVLKSDNAFANGNLALARNYLTKGLQNCDFLLKSKNEGISKEDIVHLLSRIYNRSAEISKLEGRLDDTIKAYKETVKLNQKYENFSEVGKALNNLALIYRERGELDLALKQLFSARELFQKIQDPNAMALVDVNVGDIYFLKKDYKKADNSFKSAEKATLKYPEVKGLIFGKIGRTRLSMDKFKLAEHSLLESLEAYRKSQHSFNQIKNLNDLYLCSSNLKNREASRKYLDSASRLLLEHFREHEGSELWTGLYNEYLKNAIGYCVLWDKKNLEDGISNYIDFHSRRQNPKIILDDLEQLSKELKTNQKAVVKLYSDISKILSGIDDKHPLVILNIRRSQLFIEKGNKKDAAVLLRKTYNMAKRINFDKGIQKIEEILESLKKRS